MNLLNDTVRHVLAAVDPLLLAYFFLINTSYLVLVLLSGVDLVRHRRRSLLADPDETYASPFTAPISVIVPAHNEEAGIVEAVRAIIGLRYPRFEVIVVEDGSTDGTFDVLREAYDLVEVRAVVPGLVPARGLVTSVHLPRSSAAPLTLVRKISVGSKTDAVNVGINAARHPLVCVVDADSIMDPDSLLKVARPFVDDSPRMIATGGVVRVVNNCTVAAGRVTRARMPDRWLPRIQAVEYLRSFLLGRVGWSRLGSLMVISGAFGLFRRDLLLDLGGLDLDCIGEDAELVVRAHRRAREQHREYRIRFVGDPVSWTEVPDTFRVLGNQRARWHRGLTEILIKHRGMIGNPRYGRIGLVAMPYYLVFEFLAPLIELSGLVLLPLGFAIGAIHIAFAVSFILVAYGYALLVSTFAIAADEFAYHRYSRWRDLAAAFGAAVGENLGYRQLTAYWRLRGAWAGLRRTQSAWGTMPRKGFTAPPP